MKDTIVAQLFRQGCPFSYESGDIIIRAGDMPSGIYYITTGWVKAFSLCADGEQVVLMTLRPGNIFPLAWAVGESSRSLTFSALEPTQLLRLPREEFLHLLQTRSAFSHAIFSALAQNFFTLVTDIENLHYRTAREKVVFRLLCLAKQFGQAHERGIIIPKKISNDYIARSTNMTRETASREVSRLHRKRLLHRADGYLIIPDLKQLRVEIGGHFDLTTI